MFYFLGTGVENKPILIGHSEYVDGKLVHSNITDITTDKNLLDKFKQEGVNPSIFVPRGIDMKPLVTVGSDSVVNNQGGVFNSVAMDLSLLLSNCTNQIYVLEQFKPFFFATFSQVMEQGYSDNEDNLIMAQAYFAACSAWNILKSSGQSLDLLRSVGIVDLITSTWGVPLEGKVLELISAIFDMLVTYGILSNEPDIIEIEKPFVTDSEYVSDLYVSSLIRFNEVLTREFYLTNNESKVSGEDINAEVYHTVPSVELLNSIRMNIEMGEPYSADLFPSIFEFYPKSMLDGFIAYNDYLLYKELAKTNGLPLTYITGQAEANDKDIRDNEKRYYDALMELQTLAGMKSPNYLANVTWYFKTFIEYLICVTRGHTGWAGTSENFIASIFADDINNIDEDNLDEENNDNKDTQEVGQFYTVARSRFGAQTSTTKNIISIIEQEFNKGTEDIYVQAIIRLMRWGVYKPKSMKLPLLGKYVSFETGRVSENSGILKDTDLKVVNGKSYELVGEIISYNKFSDDNYVMAKDAIGSLDFPVGYLFTQTYNTSDYVVTAFSCLDIVKMLEKGDNPFMGIEQDPNTLEIHVNSDKELTQAILDSVLTNPSMEEGRFKVCGLEELDEYVLKNGGTIGVATSTLGVLQTSIDNIDLGGFISNNSFASKQELEDKITRNGTPVNVHLQANMIKSIIPSFLKVNTQLDEDAVNPNNISAILNHYYTGFIGKSLVPVDMTDKVSAMNTESTLNKLSQFTVEAELDTTNPEDVLIKPFSGRGIKSALFVYTDDTTKGVQGLLPNRGVLYIVYQTDSARILMEPTEQFILPVSNLINKLKGTPSEGKFKLTITNIDKVKAAVTDQINRIKDGDTDGMRYVFNSKKEYDSFFKL